MKISFFKSKNIKIIVIVLIVGLIFIYLVKRKQTRQNQKIIMEKFNENEILCIKADDKDEIKQFRIDMGYKIKEIPKEKDSLFDIDTDNIITVLKGDAPITIKYKYDYIQLSSPKLTKDVNDFILSPTGVIFDPKTDDIIVFDIYRLRRFQYRLNRSQFNISEKEQLNKIIDMRNNKKDKNENNSKYNPNDIEVYTEFENKRKLLYIYFLIYCAHTNKNKFKEQILPFVNGSEILQDNYTIEDNTDKQLISIINKSGIRDEIKQNLKSNDKIKVKLDKNLVDNDEDFIDKTVSLTGYVKDSKIPLTLGELRQEVIKNLDFLLRYRRIKECRDNTVLENKDEERFKCSLNYQEDLPKYDLGKQGKGIESLNYDKKQKAPLFDNIMNPNSNSWNEPKYNGIFEPQKSYRDKRVYQTKGGKGVQINDTGTKNSVENKGMKGLFMRLFSNEEQGVDKVLVNNTYNANDTYNSIYDDKPNLLVEKFEEKERQNPVLIPGLPTINLMKQDGDIKNKDLNAGYFILPDEMEAIGVKMCIYTLGNSNYIFVPDVLNNRIQIFRIEQGAEFDYKGQFGNLDFTTIRSLPTYQGEKVAGMFEPLKNTNIMYEPIHNTEIFEKSISAESPARCSNTCEFDGDNYIGKVRNINTNEDNNSYIDSFFNKTEGTIKNETQCYMELRNKLQSQGPEVIKLRPNNTYSQNIDKYYESYTTKILPGAPGVSPMKVTGPDLSLEEENVNECVNEFSTRRANIHHRQYELDEYNNLIPVKTGHFYSLYNEYIRIKEYLKRPDLKESVYSNPFNLIDGAELCMGQSSKSCTMAKDPYDGVKGCSVAYRKFLLKVIKETNDGQKYGQLFRPKSITYDIESNLFYVADTYHHSIQCFRLKDQDKYEEGKDLVFESADKIFNGDDEKENSDPLYCYDKDWNYNMSYHSSPVYSLGLRQQILEKTREDRKNDFDKKAGEYPTKLKGDYTIPESRIEDEWCDKFSEPKGKVRLYRWVSGSSKYANYAYERANNDSIEYSNIGKELKGGKRLNKDYFFYTNLVKVDIEEGEKDDTNEREALLFPGVGEFLYPSDLVFVRRNISPVKNTDLLLVADTGNNRVSIFKKYILDIDTKDKYRYRFYRFLGDKNSVEDRKLINPIGITVNPINGCIYVLQSNFYDYSGVKYNKGQSIKVFYPKKDNDEGYYDYSHEIIINKNINLGNKDARFTKIEMDSRGIILLTDINNRRVQILKEIAPKSGDQNKLHMEKIDSNVLNKVIFKIQYNPHNGLNGIYDFFNDKYLMGYNRFRFIIERFNISTQKDTEILLSREYNHDYFASINNETRDLFVYEDKYETRPYKKGYWVMNGKKENIIDKLGQGNSSGGDALAIKPYNNLYVDIKQTNNRYGNTITDGIEDWKGNPLTPNTSYKYVFYLFNYHNTIKVDNNNLSTTVHTPPLNIPSNNISIGNVITKRENYLNINIDYLSVSNLHKDTAKYNPLCIYLLRRNHNRTRDGLLRYLNVFRHNMIQLFVPNEAKYIYNNFSKPKFGKLYILNIENAGSPLDMKEEELLEPDAVNKTKYADSKFLVFYSAEGGNLDQNGKILPTSDTLGMDYIEDFFTLGDDPMDSYTKIKYQVKIDIRQTRKDSIMLSDNTKLESNLLYYRQNRYEKDDNSLELIKKQSIVQFIEGKYENRKFEYKDSGIMKEGIKIPLPLNRTLEYNVLVANQYKINPSCNTQYFTTRPEKPYLKSVSKVEVTEGGKKVSKIKIEWYYTQNKNLYWPVNFLILRLPTEDTGSGIPTVTKVLDFLKGSPHKNDKYFNIEKDLVNVKIAGKHFFEKTFALDGKNKWQVSFTKFNNKEDPGYKNIFINGKKFIWSPNTKSHVFTNSFITIKVELDGAQDEYLSKVVVEEYIDAEGTYGPSGSETQQIFGGLIENEYEDMKKQQLNATNDAEELKRKYETELNEEYNDKLIQAVEAYRQMNKIGFYFNLQDDYEGYYRSVIDNYSGNSGQLLYYLKAQSDNDLLKIFDELHDKIKIYHGEATMTIDGPNGMLRAGGRDAIIEKIRHLSFMLKESTKTENKTLGITCKDQDLSEIFKTDGFQSALQCLTDEKNKKNTDYDSGAPTPTPEKLSRTKLNELTENFEVEQERDYISETARELEGENLQSVLQKFNYGGEWQKAGINNIVYDTVSQKVKLIKEKVSLNTNKIIPNKNTILIWRKGDRDIGISPSASQGLVTDKVKPYDILRSGKEIKSLKSYITEKDRKEILENYAIPPTLVSLSSGKDIPATEVFNDLTKDKNHLYSIQTHYLPFELDKQYSYKIACFQNGHSISSEVKRNYLGIVSKGIGSELGMGEVFSDEAYLGANVSNTQTENDLNVSIEEPVKEAPEILEPVIKYFEPKEGTEDTLVRIVGSKLDKLEYISFRDVRVKILKKQKRIIVENGDKISYDEYLVKPPTLKELNRECWQSYEPYKVLVWGYFHGTGKQIRSKETGNPDTKMYKYLVSKICPESNQQMRKYKVETNSPA